MERDGCNLYSSSQSQSWWLDNSHHNRPCHSQWLQNTLSESTELDKKIEKILEVVEDGGDTFAERAEMYYQKRPQLIEMVQELHSSYRDLASKYDLLMFKSDSTLFRSGSGMGLERVSSDSRSQFESWKPYHHRLGFEKSEERVKLTKNPFEVDNFIIYDGHDLDLDLDHDQAGGRCDGAMEELEKEEWGQLKLEVLKLMEDNLSHQTELIKRNDEKRDSIKRLVHENRRLKSSLVRAHEKPQPPRSSFSKLKRSLFRVFS